MPNNPLGISVRAPRYPVVMKEEFEKADLDWLGAVGLGSCNEEAVTTAQFNRRPPALAEAALCYQAVVKLTGKRDLAEVSSLGI